MLRKAMHVLLGTIFVGLLGAQASWAVSFGKMDVASKMGEPFYAEVPLRLSETESIGKTSVELGGAADYRILEVFRNSAVNAIRTDIVDDERGPRVTLTSEAAIDTAFFNVILKVRYGRSTHYKKIPVFLDVATNISSSAMRGKSKAQPAVPVNSANVIPGSSEAYITRQAEGAVVSKKQAFGDSFIDANERKPAVVDNFSAYDGWARTSRYGPMVYGDTVTTVAQRLRLDGKFTNQQVMVALFEKNRAKFAKDNINLIKAGTFLDVPTAAEVGQISRNQAKTFLSNQRKAWVAMQNNPEYAALAEAQKNRYSSRVRMSNTATGTSAKPIRRPASGSVSSPAQAVEKSSFIASKAASLNSNGNVNLATIEGFQNKLIEKDGELSVLQKKVQNLEARLMDAETATNADIEMRQAQTATSQVVAPVDEAANAALEAQNKRLELVVTRLKSQLTQAKTNVNSESSGMGDWLLYALYALGALVLGLLIALFMLMRKGREHPALKDDFLEEPVDDASTRVMSTDDFDMPAEVPEEEDVSDMFGSGDVTEEIPDLTDEETGEMEPFDTSGEEAPDPNVNYLEDADVYMRYGMEDEAEKHVKMALKLDGSDPEAHAKLVEVYKAKGDEDAAGQAMNAAKTLLVGGALVAFEAALSGEKVNAETSADKGAATDDLDLAGLKAEDEIDPSLTADFGYMDVGGDESSETASEDVGEAESGADVDFDFGDLSMSDELEGDTNKDEVLPSSLDSVDSGELDSIDIDFESIEMPAMDVDALEEVGTIDDDLDGVGVDSVDIEALRIDDTSEVSIGDGTQMVSTDGSEIEANETLNDFEMEKAKAALEAEENATSVELDVDGADPFSAANASLVEQEVEDASLDIDVSSIASLDGEEENLLSLDEASDKETDADGFNDLDLEELEIPSGDVDSQEVDLDAALGEADSIGLESLDMNLGSDADENVSLGDLDMDFDLPDLDAEVEEEISLTDVADKSNGDVSTDLGVSDDTDADLDDLDMDFDLPDLDADASLVSDVTEESGIDLDVSMDSTDDLGLDDLDLDFDLPDLDGADAVLTDESDSTFVMDADKAVSQDNTVDEGEEISLDDLDLDFDLPDLDGADVVMTDESDSTFVMDADKAVSQDTVVDADEEISLDDLDMDFDLPDLDADAALAPDVAEESGIDLDVPMDSTDDLGLDDLDMDFDLPDTADNPVEEALLDESTVNMLADTKESTSDFDETDLDIDGLDLGLDDLDISTTAVDPSVIESDDSSMAFAEEQDTDSVSLESQNQGDSSADAAMDTLDDIALDDFDLPGVGDELVADKDALDKTFVLNDVEKNKAMLEAEPSHFSNIDDALDSTLIMDNSDNPMDDEFSTTAELGNIERTLGSLQNDDNDPMVETLGASQELDDLMKDLDGLLDEGKDKK